MISDCEHLSLPSLDKYDHEEYPSEFNDNFKEEIQNIIIQFQECSSDEDFEFIVTPLLMLSEMLDNHQNIIIQILSFFESYFSFFFTLISNPHLESDIYQQLINLIAYITCYSDYSKYKIYISTQFFESLARILAYDIDKHLIVDIMSNIFSETDYETQQIILSYLLVFMKNCLKEKNLQHSIVRFTYIFSKFIRKFETTEIQFIDSFLQSFILNKKRIWFHYYFTFYSISNLIKRNFKVELFMTPELIETYNQCLYSDVNKVVLSSLVVLLDIVNNSNYPNFNQLFDYRKVVEITFKRNQNEQIILGGTDLLFSSAACSTDMQQYLRNFDLISLIEQSYDSASYKVRSNLANLYINLVPRNDFEMRIHLLESPFFTSSILLLIESFKTTLQQRILNIIYHTLLKSEPLNNKQYHYFLLKNDFPSILEGVSIDEEHSKLKDKILEILYNIE